MVSFRFLLLALPLASAYLLPDLDRAISRNKREAVEEADIVYFEKLTPEQRCNNENLKRIIKNTITTDVPTSIQNLTEILNRRPSDYVILCGPITQKWFQFVSKIKTFCMEGNEKVTCTVFTTKPQEFIRPTVDESGAEINGTAEHTMESVEVTLPEKTDPNAPKTDEKTGKETEDSIQFRELKTQAKKH